jgi:hypothetical protein
MEDYKYDIAECDVHDKESLVAFRKKRTEWLYWLDGGPDHGVWRQINSLLWRDAVFRLINESRGLAIRSNTTSCALNGLGLSIAAMLLHKY